MKKRSLLLAFAAVLGLGGLHAQSCDDGNGYVDSKNSDASNDYYSMQSWGNNYAAQAYHYSGPGRVLSVDITGKNNNSYHSHLRAYVYNVDGNNRPYGSAIAWSNEFNWYGSTETTKTVNINQTANVSGDFAVVIRVYSDHYGTFELAYNGDGDGAGEDLQSVRNWPGSWNSIVGSTDGDFYLVPNMRHTHNADFSASAVCNVATGDPVDFTNSSTMTIDSMFNTINLSGYSGGEVLYSWDFGDPASGAANTSTLEDASHTFNTAGVYEVELTTTIDGWDNTCSETKTMYISVGLDATAVVDTDVACNGAYTGQITVTGAGGDDNSYSYRLNGSSWQSSDVFTGLPAGTYTAYIQDGQGCTETGNTVTITQPSLIELSSTMGITMPTCGNADGSLIVTASGGTGTLEYSLDGSTYQATGEFHNLAAGTITIYVEDANGCVVTPTVVLANPVAPSLALQTYSNVSCNGGNNGSITLTGSGGTGALEYSLDGITFQASNVFNNIPAGNYTPSVQDATGCIGAGADVTITEPVGGITFSLTSTDVICNGDNTGSLTVLSPIGGTGTLNFSIGSGFQSDFEFPNLSAGTYTVTAEDVLGCTATEVITVGEPDLLVASIVSSQDASCNLFIDGEFEAAATGGLGSYAFSIDGNLFYSETEFTNLGAGTYTVDVIDGNWCEASTTVTIGEPTAITAVITTGNSTCGNPDGTLLAAAAGGSGSGYLYSIDDNVTTNGTGAFNTLDADNYTVIVTDGDACEQEFDAVVTDSDGPVIASFTSTDITCHDGTDGSITITSVTGGTGTINYNIDGGPFSTSNVFTGLGEGDHEVSVEDANGCFNSTTINLAQPSAFAITLTATALDCYGDNNGEISVSAAGGSGTLTYSIDGVNFPTTSVFTGLSADTYTVTVQDAGGCQGDAVITIEDPKEVELSATVLNVTCFAANDGVIYASATGGTGSFEYKLGNGTYQASGTFTGVSGGVHFVYAKDGADCEQVILVSISEPTPLLIDSHLSDVSCAGGDDGVIDVTTTGGTAPYTYTWSNFSTAEDLFNLAAGSYSVMVVDANGCNVQDNYSIIEPSNPIIVNGTVTNATGSANADGSIDVTTTGGTAPYTYDWSNSVTTEDNDNVIPGVYSVTATDANGCSVTSGFTVTWNVGITDIVTEDGVSIYPNPASDVVFVELTGNDMVDGIQLVNMIGETIYQATSNDNKYEIDVTTFSNGIYFINIQQGDDIITKKFVINK